VQPSEFQQFQLARMTGIITHSSEARTLVQNLWEFFEFRLECRLPNIDKEEPSYWRIEIERFLQTRKAGDLAPQVVIRDSPRREEALVHELLHLNLIALGYPRFRINAKDDRQWHLAGGIVNNADHSVMLPTFKSFGYSEDRFLGNARPATPLEKQVQEDLEQFRSDLCSPEGYGGVISDYLQSHSIEHETVWIAKMICF
jgi:hypothetical protein